MLILISILLAGCSSLPEKKIMLAPNPTSFVFKSNEETVKNAILTEMGDLKFRNMMLYFKGGDFIPLDTTEIFLQPGNENDYYLTPTYIWIGQSYLYPDLPYTASFRIHPTRIDDKHTELTIYTIKPQVISGKNFFPSLPHFVRDYKYHDVEPSTVEEYEILYKIGKSLNEDMPDIKYPAK